MRIVYMGTPDFAVPSLEALVEAGYQVVAVVTQPDAIRGRGKKIRFSQVKEKALEYGIDVLQPERVKGNEAFYEKLKNLNPDLIVVAAYGQILPREVLELPRLGCINVHGSLLPRFRGAAPIQRAIIAGDEVTGITIMRMEEGLDTGDMLAKVSVPIGAKTGEELHDELAVAGARLLVDTVPKLEQIKGEKQDDSLACYSPMIFKSEGHVDFSMGPAKIERIIRAFDPWPGTYAYMGEKQIKLWHGIATGKITDAENGTIVGVGDEGIDIASAGEILRVDVIQMPGKKRVQVKEYLKGNSVEINTVLR